MDSPGQTSRQASTGQVDYYIGIDVGTGSARTCIIDGKGDIVALASENIGLWQPQHGYYVGISLCPALGSGCQFSFPVIDVRRIVLSLMTTMTS
jgi:hypothetical protein